MVICYFCQYLVLHTSLLWLYIRCFDSVLFFVFVFVIQNIIRCFDFAFRVIRCFDFVFSFIRCFDFAFMVNRCFDLFIVSRCFDFGFRVIHYFDLSGVNQTMLTASGFFCESSFVSVSSFVSIIIICLLPQKSVSTENLRVFCVV